jgi:hypothetical protein
MSWRSRESTAKAPAARAAPGWPGLAIAAGAPLAITALKLALSDYLGHMTPFLPYFAATLIGPWSGGLLAGVLAVALSAALGGQLSDKQRAHAAGFDDHLIKPVSLEASSSVLVRLPSS